MKKIFVILFFILFSNYVFAQTVYRLDLYPKHMGEILQMKGYKIIDIQMSNGDLYYSIQGPKEFIICKFALIANYSTCEYVPDEK